MLNPRIDKLSEKKLTGLRQTMSMTDNKTAELWQNFMPRRKEIIDALNTGLFSLQVYGRSYFENFDPTREFEKWALVEVANFTTVPDRMETFTLNSGLYAVFDYKGSSAESANFFRQIFTGWLPNSNYSLDGRLLATHHPRGLLSSRITVFDPAGDHWKHSFSPSPGGNRVAYFVHEVGMTGFAAPTPGYWLDFSGGKQGEENFLAASVYSFQWGDEKTLYACTSHSSHRRVITRWKL